MKQIILSFGLLLAATIASKAQNVRVYNVTNCPVDVVVTEYDAFCSVISVSASTTVNSGLTNYVDFSVTSGNSYEVEVVNLWLNGFGIPPVGSGCGAVAIQGPVSAVECSGIWGAAYSQVIPTTNPPGVDLQVAVHF